MPDSPCYQCEKRSELCHSSCHEYKNYRAELDAYKEFLAGASNNKEGIAALSGQICMEQENAYFTSPAFIGSSDARDQVGQLLVNYISAEKGTTKDQLRQLFTEAYNRCVSLNK